MANFILDQTGQEIQHVLDTVGNNQATQGQILTADGSGGVSWQNAPSTGMTNPMTTSGDIIYGGSSGSPTRLARGSAGQVLTMDSNGLYPSWQNASAGGKSVTYSITDLFTNVSKIQNILNAATNPGNNYLIVAFDVNPLASIGSDVDTIIVDLNAVQYNTQMIFRKVVSGTALTNEFSLTSLAQSGSSIATVNQYLTTTGYYILTSDVHTATV